jgi:Zn ribbon nucleic-acid-binding protein
MTYRVKFVHAADPQKCATRGCFTVIDDDNARLATCVKCGAGSLFVDGEYAEFFIATQMTREGELLRTQNGVESW